MEIVHILHNKEPARAGRTTMSPTAKGYVTTRKKRQQVVLGFGQKERNDRKVKDLKRKVKEIAKRLDPEGNARISYPDSVIEPSVKIEYNFLVSSTIDYGLEEFVNEVAFYGGELLNQDWVLIEWPSFGYAVKLELSW